MAPHKLCCLTGPKQAMPMAQVTVGVHKDTDTATCVLRMARACCRTHCTLHHPLHGHCCMPTSILFFAGAADAVPSRLSALTTGLEPDDDAEPPHDEAMVAQQTGAPLDGKPASGGSNGEASAEPTPTSEAALTGGTQEEASIAGPAAAIIARHAALDSAMAALSAMVAQPAVSRSAAGADGKGSATDSQADTQAAGSEGAKFAAERATDGGTGALARAGAAAGVGVEAELAGASSAVGHPDDGFAASEHTAEEPAVPQQPNSAARAMGLPSSTSATSHSGADLEQNAKTELSSDVAALAQVPV